MLVGWLVGPTHYRHTGWRPFIYYVTNIIDWILATSPTVTMAETKHQQME